MSTQTVQIQPIFPPTALESRDKRLKPRQAVFAYQFVFGPDFGNPRKCAETAGYSLKTAGTQASALLHQPIVIAEIARLEAIKLERSTISSNYVLSTIKSTVDRCLQSEPVTDAKGNAVLCDTPDGRVVPAYQFDASNALKGLELLGKHKRLFADVTILDIGENLAGFLTQARQRTGMVLDAEVLEGQEDGK